MEILLGSAHSGYPIMDIPPETYLFDMIGREETLIRGDAWGWTPSDLDKVKNNIFAEYVNEKYNPLIAVNHGYTDTEQYFHDC